MTSALQKVAISLGDRSYDIHIGSGLLAQPDTWTGLPKAQAAMIVTNDTIAPLYEAQLRAALAPHYPQVHTVVLPDGEAHKDWQTLNLIFDALLARGCDRRTVLFALGGITLAQRPVRTWLNSTIIELDSSVGPATPPAAWSSWSMIRRFWVSRVSRQSGILATSAQVTVSRSPSGLSPRARMPTSKRSNGSSRFNAGQSATGSGGGTVRWRISSCSASADMRTA